MGEFKEKLRHLLGHCNASDGHTCWYIETIEKNGFLSDAEFSKLQIDAIEQAAREYQPTRRESRANN